METSALIVDISTITILVGTLIPVLVALVTKKVANSGLKGALNATLSVATGVLNVLVANGGMADVTAMVNAALLAFTASIVTYYGLLKPTGITGKVQDSTASFGIGG